MMDLLKQIWGNAFFVTMAVIFGFIGILFAFSIFSVMGSIFFNAYNQATQGFIR